MTREKLFDKLQTLLEERVVILSSPAGTGKSTVLEQYAKDNGYEKIFIKRMSGMTEELLQGIPEKTDGKFEFLKVDFIHEITQTQKDEKIFLFLDEVNRTPARLRPALFSLFERIIDGVKYKNMHVVCAINEGDDYVSNWEIGEDKALLNRVYLVENFSLDRQDVFEFFDDNNYNHVLKSALGRLDNLYSTNTTGENPNEQITTMRAWSGLNHVFAKKNVEDIQKANEVFQEYGMGFMNKETFFKLQNIFEQMIRTQKSISIPQLIMSGSKKEQELEVLLSVKDFATNSINKEFITSHLPNIIGLLKKKKELLKETLSAMIKNKIVDKKQLLTTMSSELSKDDKKVMLEIMEVNY